MKLEKKPLTEFKIFPQEIQVTLNPIELDPNDEKKNKIILDNAIGPMN